MSDKDTVTWFSIVTWSGSSVLLTDVLVDMTQSELLEHGLDVVIHRFVHNGSPS